MLSFFGKEPSILKKFLLINFIIFSITGLITIFYLMAVEPSLVKKKSLHHVQIIDNTINHIERLNIRFEKDEVAKFLLSTRFLFQNLDRVQLYDLNYNLLADTDTLDLVQDVFVRSENIQETSIDKMEENINLNENLKATQTNAFNTENYVKKYSEQNNLENKLVISETTI